MFQYFTETSFVTLDVKYRDIIKLLIHFGKSMPVLFFYTSINTGAMIRELLGMQDPKGPYYDPAGKGVYTYMNVLYLSSFYNLMIILKSIIYFLIFSQFLIQTHICRKGVNILNRSR